MAAAAAAIHSPSSVPETLQTIVDVARDAMPDIDHVGVTLGRRGGKLETAAGTGPLVYEIDRIQYDLADGPCVTALRDGSQPVVVCEEFRHESRWRDFVLRAVPHGLRSVMAVRISGGGRTLGVLNLYSTSTDVLGEETRTVAQLFATHAAYAYGHVREVGNLHAALESRELIGNAVGVVMERYGLDRERAFEYLVRVAATSEVKLRVVATELLAPFDASLRKD